MTEIRPLGTKLIVRPDEEVTSVNGMDIPDEARKKPITGTVLKVGPKVDTSFVKEGDKVAYNPFAVMTADIYGEVVTYVREEDVVFVISE